MHLVALIALEELWAYFPSPAAPNPQEIQYVLLGGQRGGKKEAEPDKPEPEVSGQIVETPPTEEQENPKTQSI